MFKIISEAIGVAAHATLPRSAPSGREAPPPVRPLPIWPRQG